jgi:hypothetical protein
MRVVRAPPALLDIFASALNQGEHDVSKDTLNGWSQDEQDANDYDRDQNQDKCVFHQSLTPLAPAANSRPLAHRATLPEQSEIKVDQNGPIKAINDSIDHSIIPIH